MYLWLETDPSRRLSVLFETAGSECGCNDTGRRKQQRIRPVTVVSGDNHHAPAFRASNEGVDVRAGHQRHITGQNEHGVGTETVNPTRGIRDRRVQAGGARLGNMPGPMCPRQVGQFTIGRQNQDAFDAAHIAKRRDDPDQHAADKHPKCLLGEHAGKPPFRLQQRFHRNNSDNVTHAHLTPGTSWPVEISSANARAVRASRTLSSRVAIKVFSTAVAT